MALFMNKDITKAIMKWTIIRNNNLKNRYNANRKGYNAQRNLYVSLVRKVILFYHKNFKLEKVPDDKTFWKTVKSFFTDKEVNHVRIFLVKENELPEKQKKFFADIVKILNIPQYEDQLVSTDNIGDPILRVEEKF